MFIWVQELVILWNTRHKRLYDERVENQLFKVQTESEAREREMQHELDLRVCNSCEVMKAELNKAHSRELELLELLRPKPQKNIEDDEVERKPLNQHIPWSIKRRQLEAAARVKKITADDLDTELEEVRGK